MTIDFNNKDWSIFRVLHEAMSIDRAYNMGLEEDTISDHNHIIIPNANKLCQCRCYICY